MKALCYQLAKSNEVYDAKSNEVYDAKSNKVYDAKSKEVYDAKSNKIKSLGCSKYHYKYHKPFQC